MSKAIQSGYYMEYDNKIPSLSYDIKDVSPIVKTYYNKKLKNAKTVEEMLSRPVRYVFYVTELIPNATSCKKHTCYYDSKKLAEEAHKKAVLAFYDQMTKPMLKRLERKTKLTQREQNKIVDIQNRFKAF